MLNELTIENIAVIEKAQVRFESGLNVLTGETGAGKSILIDSINAILGNRTSRDLVRNGALKGKSVGHISMISPLRSVLCWSRRAMSRRGSCFSIVKSV